MSSSASKENIHEEKQAAAPTVTTTAVPASKAPSKGKKEKEVHNVSAMGYGDHYLQLKWG